MFFESLFDSKKQFDLTASIVGGSNSVMRKGYAKYLSEYLYETTSLNTSIEYYSLGGVPNIFGTIQEDRHNLAAKSDIIFFEYCVNDRHAIETGNYSLELVEKSLEGFIRKCQKSNPRCLIVIIIFGVNKDDYYSQACKIEEVYESIARHYSLPVINLTELFRQQSGVDFIKSLYDDKDVAHYTRPEGVKVVARKIVEQLDKLGVVDRLKSDKNLSSKVDVEPIYPDNFENLVFFEDFEKGDFFDRPAKVSTYQNSVFREKNFTLVKGNQLRFLLKGQLVAIYLKSDLSDGVFEIKHGEQSITASSYSEWVTAIRSNNINLITLPLRRFKPSSDFSLVSISCCEEYPDSFELDYIKQEPKKKDPQKWRLNVIGVAYIGELKPWS